MKKILILMIKIYQLCLSPFIGNHCRFTPTCSMYTIEALRHYGVIKGSWLSIKRLCRCHPKNKGGYDPLPIKKGN